jgi:hypothetical protein
MTTPSVRALRWDRNCRGLSRTATTRTPRLLTMIRIISGADRNLLHCAARNCGPLRCLAPAELQASAADRLGTVLLPGPLLSNTCPSRVLATSTPSQFAVGFVEPCQAAAGQFSSDLQRSSAGAREMLDLTNLRLPQPPRYRRTNKFRYGYRKPLPRFYKESIFWIERIYFWYLSGYLQLKLVN